MDRMDNFESELTALSNVVWDAVRESRDEKGSGLVVHTYLEAAAQLATQLKAKLGEGLYSRNESLGGTNE